MTTTRERNLRVVLFTVLPPAAANISKLMESRGHRVVGILTAPGPRSRRTDGYLEIAQLARPGLDVIVSNYPNRWAEMIRPLRPDLIACGAFNWKIPADVLEVPRLGAINGHDALLPRYRGRNATGWALRNDETAYGATVHRMTATLDEGAILGQRPIPICDEDDIESIWGKWGPAVTASIHEAMERIETHDPGTPQDESLATYTGGAFEPEWRYLDWNRTARENFIQIRSWYGGRDVPRGAFGQINGRQALITRAFLTGTQSIAEPGTVLERREDGSLLIQCADGPLEIRDWSYDSA